MKCCSKCRVEQPETNFVKSPRYLDGLYPSCKSCRSAVKLKTLAENPMCIACGAEPHLGYIGYCARCHRIKKGRAVPTRIVDRTNTTMCSKCKTMPRLSYHNYCRECKNAATITWQQRHGGSWDCLSEEGKKKATARALVNTRVKRGKMRAQPCEVCGSSPAEKHHHKGYDGENVYDVRWLCKAHHLEAEKK